jgi:uncharacterized protein
MTAGHRHLLKTSRLIHLIVSMFGMVALLFFAVTGLLLNHEADWFDLDDQVTETTHYLPSDLVHEIQTAAKKKVAEVRRSAEMSTDQPMPTDLSIKIAEFKVVEFFRTAYDTRGEARCDLNEDVIGVDFKSPGRNVVAEIQCQEGTFKLISRSKGLLGKFLDLHRGKNKGSGLIWSLLLDASCVIMVFLSMTGLVIWSSLKTRRVAGLLALMSGITATVGIYLLWVP